MRKSKHINNAIKLVGLFALMLLKQTVLASTSSAYQLDDHSIPENIGIYTHYIEDKEGNLFLEDIIDLGNHTGSNDDSALWRQAPQEGLAEGFTDSVYWLRFTISNTSSDDIRWYLEFRYPILDSIEFFTPDEHGEYTKQIAGDAYPFDQRPIEYRNILFSRTTPNKVTQTFYVRVDSTSSLFIPLYIWPKDSFFQEIDKVKLLLGVLYGIVGLALFISLVNAIFLKDIMYIWLSGIFVCFFLYLCSIKGVAFQTLWPNSLYWQEVSIPFFMNMSYAFGFLYCRSYLNLKDSSHKLDLLCKALATLGFVSAILALLMEYRSIIGFSTVMTMLSQVICLSVGTYCLTQGNKSARLFIPSWIALFGGAVSFALIALGAIPKTFLTEWMQEMGFGAMVTLMIIAQFDRFLQIQKSHEQNQIKSLEAIQNAEKKYRSLFENAIEGIFQMDNKGVLTNVNNAFAQILGLKDIDQLVATQGTPFSLGFMSENDGNKLQALVTSQETLNDYKISFTNPTGEVRWVSIAIQKVLNQSNGDFHYEGSLTDVTDSKQRENAEKQRRMAEASTEAKSMFLANMSHEIRTPMNAIIGFTDLAVKANQDKNLSEFLRKIKTASSNLLGIINDILDFSKIEAGKLKIESIPFNLRELMSNISDIVEGSIESKGLSFTVDIDEDIPDVLIGDSLRLHQILLNLTNNAVKFTPEGTVRVEIDLLAMNKKKGTIKLEGRVIDTGVGISQEKQNKLFTSFSQADESTTRTFGGTGLGLSISKQLITLMGGDISVQSIEGQGSVFEFNFQCRLESRKANANTKNAKLNVLIVDDNNDSRLLIENVIKDIKHTYTSVSSTKEALEVLQASQNDALTYDLILIDWLMPDSDGFDCLQKLQALPSFDMPKTTLVTTYGEEGLKERALAAGFDAYIEKPIKKEHVQQIVGHVFESTPSPSPRLQTQSSEKVEDTPTNGSFNGVQALVVEDVPMNQELAREILRKQGITCTFASDGEQGVEAAQGKTFDIILMDMQMPVMDGCEATSAIREFDEQIPIIAMTANAMLEDKKRCFAAGMNDFVTKPINDKELFSTLAKYLPKSESKDIAPLNASESVDIEITESMVTSDQAAEEVEPTNTNPSETLASSLSEDSENSVNTADIENNPNQEESDSTKVTLPDSLPSIDLQDGLERCQNNQKLYLKLLGDFIRNYGSSAHEMRAMLGNNELDSLAKLAHTLKGLSANLGATPLSSYAMKLEHIADIPDSEQASSIDKFAEILSELRKDLEELLTLMHDESDASGQNVTPYSEQERKDLIEALTGMINEQKMDAYDQAVEAADRWPDEVAKAELNELIEQLDLFEFEAAKQSIEQIKEKIQ